MIVAGLLMPVLTRLGINAWSADLWRHEHAPNQGAMVVGGIAVVASIIVGVGLALIGILLALIGWMRDQ